MSASHRAPRRSGRLAACLAIAAAVAFAATLIRLVVRQPGALLLVLALVVAAGTGAWVALTRRGARRFAGAACVAGAVAAEAVALVVLGLLDELALLLVSGGLFMAAGRAAARSSLRRQKGAQSISPPRAQGAGSSGRKVLIMNPKSGGGKVGRFDLVEEARRRGIEPLLLGRGDDLRALARETAASAQVIGMAGGDGSQALVAQVAMEADIPFVCVPAGTRNHLALDLGLDRDDVVGALDAFGGEVERRIDLAFVNERIFVNNVSLGVYAQIVQSEAYRNAKLRTVERMLPDLLGPDAEPFDLRFRDRDGGDRRSAQLILVSNNPYVLDRLGGMGSRPRLDTGLLGIVAVQIDDAVQAAELISLELVGRLRRYGGWAEWSAERFEVMSRAAVAAGVDGEAVLLEPPLRFTIAPAALTVRLPPDAPGFSPAALTSHRGRRAARQLRSVS